MLAKCNVGDRQMVMLWHDIWNNHNLHEELPRLYSYAKNIKVSVAAYMANTDTAVNFYES